MSGKKLVSHLMCTILILSVISFGYLVGAADSTDDFSTDTTKTSGVFDPQKFIEEVKKTTVGELSKKIDELKSLEDTNKLLEHIGKSINQEGFKELRDTAEIVTQKIISKKSGRELGFKITDDAKIDNIKIEEGDGGKNPTLNIGVKGKNFKIGLDNLPKNVNGIGITGDGVSYFADKAGEQRIEISDPSVQLIEEDGNMVLQKYKGLDGEEHKVGVSFSDAGRVTVKEDGVIEFSGGAEISDPETKTRFSLKDKKGKPGQVNFYNTGHIVKSLGNEIIVKKEEEGLTVGIIKNTDTGVFIQSESGITKEFSGYPSGFDKQNSLLIDPEGKKVFVPENQEIKWSINGEGYALFGDPNTPQGGVKLDGSKLFGNGGKIFGNGSLPPGNGGPGGGGGGDGGGGGIGGIGKWLLIIGGIALAIALIAALAGGGKKDGGSKGGSGGEHDNRSSEERQPDDLGYNDEDSSVSTGKAATPNPTEKTGPTIQSPYSSTNKS